MKLEWKTCLKLGITAALFFLFIHYWDAVIKLCGLAISASKPLILGVVIAYVVNILMSFYEDHYFTRLKDTMIIRRSRRAVCMVLAYLSVIGIAILVVYIVVPQVIECGQLLINEIPIVINRIVRAVEDNKLLSDALNEAGIQIQSSKVADWQDTAKKALGLLVTGLGGVMGSLVSVVSGVFSTAVTILIGVIFSIYLLGGKEHIYGQIVAILRTYLRSDFYRTIRYVYHNLNNSFHKFIVGQCTEAVILGVLCIVGMTICRFPYATMIGAFIGFTALIPVAGAYIGAAVGAFMILTVSPVKAILFLVFIVILQQLEGNIIYPKVVGSSIGLPGIWVLAAVTIGGSVMGIGGMLLGVPIAAACYQMIKVDIKDRSGKTAQKSLAMSKDKHITINETDKKYNTVNHIANKTTSNSANMTTSNSTNKSHINGGKREKQTKNKVTKSH